MRIVSVLLAVSALWLASQPVVLAAPQGTASTKEQRTPTEGYTPGLGEFMSSIQMRHAKLWFAGKDKNWQLAAYELDELKEAFEDVAKYQPEFKGKPIAEMIGTNITQPLAELEKAVDMKNAILYERAFDNLSNACSSCHQEAGYGFISIQRPTIPPLTNQRFEPHNP